LSERTSSAGTSGMRSTMRSRHSSVAARTDVRSPLGAGPSREPDRRSARNTRGRFRRPPAVTGRETAHTANDDPPVGRQSLAPGAMSDGPDTSATSTSSGALPGVATETLAPTRTAEVMRPCRGHHGRVRVPPGVRRVTRGGARRL
jgi:hypothetical protein